MELTLIGSAIGLIGGVLAWRRHRQLKRELAQLLAEQRRQNAKLDSLVAA